MRVIFQTSLQTYDVFFQYMDPFFFIKNNRKYLFVLFLANLE